MEANENRKQRRKAGSAEPLDTEAFVKLADRFIDVANRANQKILATDIHMAFLYAAARYNAFVGRHIREIDDHEAFVEEMANIYREMLRNHLADPDL